MCDIDPNNLCITCINASYLYDLLLLSYVMAFLVYMIFFFFFYRNECLLNIRSKNNSYLKISNIQIHLPIIQELGRFGFRGNTAAGGNKHLNTEIDRRSQNLRHLYPGMELQLGLFAFFPRSNNCNSSEAYMLRSECEDKHVSNAARRAKIVAAFFFFFFLRLFPRVWSVKTQIPTTEFLHDVVRTYMRTILPRSQVSFYIARYGENNKHAVI